MKTSQFRVRLNDDNSAALRNLADKSGLSPIDIATTLLHSALVAVRESKGTASFPFKFKIQGFEQSTRTIEPELTTTNRRK